MTPSRTPDDPLRSFLDEAESDLSRRLHEACEAEARGIASESTAEIRRLEDTLLSAAMAAERTIAARRHLRQGTSEGTSPSRPESGRTSAHVPDPAEEATAHDEYVSSDGTIVRQFEDGTGRRWRAWPVTPDLRGGEASRRSLGEFREGWICFEAVDLSGRRRLPHQGRRWSDLPAEELPRLLTQAIDVPARKVRSPLGETSPDARDAS
jgi:hypothetical protein